MSLTTLTHLVSNLNLYLVLEFIFFIHTMSFMKKSSLFTLIRILVSTIGSSRPRLVSGLGSYIRLSLALFTIASLLPQLPPLPCKHSRYPTFLDSH
jgi:hypothetical protein